MTLPVVLAIPGALADVDLTAAHISAVVVAVAPALEQGEGIQPRSNAADVAARYGIDLAELAERASGSAFSGKAGDVSVIDLPHAHVGSAAVLPWNELPHRIILLGVGAGTDRDLRAAGTALAGATRGGQRVVCAVTSDAAPQGVTAFVEGYLLGAYRVPRFDSAGGDPRTGQVKPRQRDRDSGPDGARAMGAAEQLELVGTDAADAVEAATRAAQATWLVRDLANTPSNIKNPQWFAGRVEELAGGLGLEIRVRGRKELTAQGFGAILAVGAASDSPPRLVTVTYPGRPVPSQQRVAIVGKGITYDTGGLSIKPREAMVPMKTDMAGAAVALATVLAAAAAGLPHRVTAVLPLAENHVGAAAMRPGDVVRTYNGFTVEVADTDAEGRMVLADGLAFAAQERPDLLIDVATLTGAATVGLGRGHAAMYTWDDELAASVERAGAASGEQVWRMPLVDDYLPALQSSVAMARNIPEKSPGGGSITAALFLRMFTDGLPWVHLDIAGPARSEAGATGYGARLLLRLLEDLPELT